MADSGPTAFAKYTTYPGILTGNGVSKKEVKTGQQALGQVQRQRLTKKGANRYQRKGVQGEVNM